MKSNDSSFPCIVQTFKEPAFFVKYNITGESFWKDNTLFQFNIQDIKSITIEYPKKKEQGFQIIKTKNSDFEIFRLQPSNQIPSPEQAKIYSWLSCFSNVKHEGIEKKLSDNQIDSIKSSIPESIIRMETTAGIKQIFKTYLRRNPTNAKGDFPPFDLNKLYAISNDEKEVYIVSYIDIDPIMREIDYFL
jgi:hypothetical protein